MSRERRAVERLALKGIGAIILTALAFWAVPQVWDKLSPFVIAVPLAAMLQPVIRFAQDKLKIRRGITALICVLLFIGILIGATYWGVTVVLEQAPQVVGQSGSMITEAVNSAQQAMGNLVDSTESNFSPQVQNLIRNTLQDALDQASKWGSEAAGKVVSFAVGLITGLPYGIIYISFLAMAVYFIAIHYSDIRSYLPGGKRRRQDSNTTQLTNSALKSLMGYLRVQGTFALMVFVVSLIALHVFGFRYAAVLALVAGIMEMIPMIGSGLMYILMAIVFFLTGNTAGGFQVLALTGVLQLLRRILEPKLMSDSIGISPLLSLIGMFAGMRFGGVLGLIGGPVAMSVLVGAVRGDVFKNLNDDLYVLVQWFKRRWAGAGHTEEPDSRPPNEALKETEEKPEPKNTKATEENEPEKPES